jgi:hypothetical protein
VGEKEVAVAVEGLGGGILKSILSGEGLNFWVVESSGYETRRECLDEKILRGKCQSVWTRDWASVFYA